jgi:hypothetical protein
VNAFTHSLNTALSDADSHLHRIQLHLEAWKVKELLWKKGAAECEECHFCEHNEDRVPYGEGYAVNSYTTCSLGERANDNPRDCPAYQAHLRVMKEDEELSREG